MSFMLFVYFLIGPGSYQPKTYSENGLLLHIHNCTDPIYGTNILRESIYIKPGHDTLIKVQRSVYKKTSLYLKSSKMPTCIYDLQDLRKFDNNSIYDYFIFLNQTEYNQELCMDICRQNFIWKKLNCCFYLLPCKSKNGKYCTLTSDNYKYIDRIFYATENSLDDNKSSSTNNEIDQCRTICVEKCVRQTFALSQSELSLSGDTDNGDFLFKEEDAPSDEIRKNEYKRYKFIKESILGLTITYSDLTYTLIEENLAITFAQLISNLGGSLGLCIGISLLSIFELFELITDLGVLCVRRKLLKRKIEKFEIRPLRKH
jgi:hypothetical protein